MKNAITPFQIVTTADFWIGMGKAIMGIAQGFIALPLAGIANVRVTSLSLFDSSESIPELVTTTASRYIVVAPVAARAKPRLCTTICSGSNALDPSFIEVGRCPR